MGGSSERTAWKPIWKKKIKIMQFLGCLTRLAPPHTTQCETSTRNYQIRLEPLREQGFFIEVREYERRTLSKACHWYVEEWSFRHQSMTILVAWMTIHMAPVLLKLYHWQLLPIRMKHSEPPKRNLQLTNVIDSFTITDSVLTAIEVTQT